MRFRLRWIDDPGKAAVGLGARRCDNGLKHGVEGLLPKGQQMRQVGRCILQLGQV